MSRFFNYRNLIIMVNVLMLVTIAHQSVMAGVSATSQSPGNVLQNDVDRFNDALGLYGSCKFTQSLQISKDLISRSKDADIVDAAKLLDVLCTRSLYGYETAVREASNMGVSPKVSDLIKQLMSEDALYKNELSQAQSGSMSDRSLVRLGWMQTLYGRQPDTVTAYDRMIAQHSRQGADIAWTFSMVNMLILSGESNKAKTLVLSAYDQINTSGAKSGPDVKTAWTLANLLIRIGEFDKAKSIALASLSANADNVNSPYLVHIISTCDTSRNKGFQACIDSMTQLIKRLPGTRAGYCAMKVRAEVSESAGDIPGAMLQYAELINIPAAGKYSSDAYRGMVEVVSAHKQDDQTDHGLKSISSVCHGTRAGSQAYLLLGRMYKENGNTSKAENAFESLVAAYPTGVEVEQAKTELINIYQDQGTAMLSSGNGSAAYTAWRKAYGLDSNETRRAEVLCKNALALIGKQKYSDARNLLKVLKANTSRAVSKWQERADYLDASIYFQSGDYNSALPLLKQIVSTARFQDSKSAAKDLIIQIESKTSAH